MTTPLPSSLGPLQVIPPGLLGFFQLKSAGVLPSLLSYEVQPSLEMRDWYFQARQQDEISFFGAVPISNSLTTGSQGAQGFSAGVTPQVPRGQYWYVTEATAGVTAFIAAADTIRVALMTFNALGGNTILRGPDYNDLITARTRSVQCRNDHPFWLGPGDTFGLMVYDILSVAGITFNLRLRFTPLPI
jgi:hypothetical protein